jgi:hypothetical protein
VGDTFQVNGVKVTDPYRIADLIDDGLDASGRGLVTFVAQNALVTKSSSSIQRGVNLVPTGSAINVQAGDNGVPSSRTYSALPTCRTPR